MGKFLPSYKLLTIFSFAAIYLIWGTTFLAIVIGLEDFPPFLMASLRFFIAGVLLVAYCIYKGEALPSRSSLAKNTLLGLLVLTGGQGLLIWAEQYIASGYAAILVATLPIWFVLIDRQNWTVYFRSPAIILGVLMGFVGIILLFKETLESPIFSAENARLELLASLAVLFGAICWVAGTLYHRSKPAPGSIYSNLGWQLLAGSVICFLISVAKGELTTFQINTVDWSAWSAVVYLSVAGSIVAFIAYTWLLTQKPSAVVGTYAYINPVIALFLGWLWAGEVVTPYQITGMLVILASAILVNINKSKVL